MTLFVPENHYFLGKIQKNEGKIAFFCQNIWYNANYVVTLHRISENTLNKVKQIKFLNYENYR